MDIFEFVMVMVSLVVGLGLTQVLRGMGKIVRSTRRFPALTLWVVVLFLMYAQMWWSLWDLSEITWTQLSFFYVLAIPCSLFGATELLVPHTTPQEVDWREHFFTARPWFFGTFAVFFLLASSFTWVLLDVPLTHPYRITQLIGAVLIAVGLLSKRPRTHFWIVVIWLAGFLVGQTAFRLAPASL